MSTLGTRIGLIVVFCTSAATAQSIKADHTTLDVDVIPSSALDAARALHMSLDHASVGGNILDGMNDLASADASRYAFPNWYWHERGNPGWQPKVDQFTDWVTAHQSEYDVMQMKFCFIDDDANFTYYRDAMLALETAHPTKQFVWWTMPIETSGNQNRDAFNSAVRSYAQANDKPLYDIAAIESHDASGAPNTEGGFEAMVEAYSSDGGHLNATGRLRAAKGMWWMMARLGGWDPGGGGTGGTGGSSSGGGSSQGGTSSGGTSAGGASSGGTSAAGSSGGPASSSGDDSGCNVGGHGAPSPWLAALTLLGAAALGRRRS